MSKPLVPFFKHTVDVHEDARFIRLQRDAGFTYLGMFWPFVERLRKSPDYRLNTCDLTEVFYKLHIPPEEGKKFIEHCKEAKLLSIKDDSIFSPWLDEQMEEYKRKCETNRNNRLGTSDEKERPLSTVNETKRPLSDENSVSISISSSVSSLESPENLSSLEPPEKPPDKPPKPQEPPVPTWIRYREGVEAIDPEGLIWLTMPEYDKLCADHGEEEVTKMYQQMRDYALTNDKIWKKKYRDHAAVFRNWFRRRTDTERRV